jgi:hypothetical protein
MDSTRTYHRTLCYTGQRETETVYFAQLPLTLHTITLLQDHMYNKRSKRSVSSDLRKSPAQQLNVLKHSINNRRGIVSTMIVILLDSPVLHTRQLSSHHLPSQTQSVSDIP